MTGRPVAGLWHRSCAVTRACACWRGPGGGPLNGGCPSGWGARPRRGLSGRRPGAAGWSWGGGACPAGRFRTEGCTGFVRRGGPVRGRLVRGCPSAAGCFVAPGMPGHVSGRCPGLPGHVQGPARAAAGSGRRSPAAVALPECASGRCPAPSPGRHRYAAATPGPVSAVAGTPFPALPGGPRFACRAGRVTYPVAVRGGPRFRRRVGHVASPGVASPSASRPRRRVVCRPAGRVARHAVDVGCVRPRRRAPAPLAGTRQGSFPPCSVNSLVPQAP